LKIGQHVAKFNAKHAVAPFSEQLIELKFNVPLDTKLIISETFFPATLLV